MEVREILICSTKTQRRYKIMTDATTLGQLKRVLDENDIDYEGMTFTEGISKLELTNDDSQLPQNVKYKDQETNNLIILLTNTKKNIPSGSAEREAAFEAVRANGLQETIKEQFGRVYTSVSTADLWKVINETLEEKLQEPVEEVEIPTEKVPEALVASIYDHVKLLAKCGLITSTEIDGLMDLLGELADRIDSGEFKPNTKISMGNIEVTDADLDNMLNGIN